MQLFWGFLLVCSAFALNYEEENDVLILTDDNFDQAIEEFSTGLLVKFYAPWCGHCKKMAPDYAKAATKLRKEDPPIYIAKCDATAQTKIAERYGIKGYPNVKFFVNKSPIDFGGERTEDGIANWVLKKLSPPVAIKDTLAEIEAQILKDNVLVTFFGDEKHEKYSDFNKACQRLDDVNCYSTADANAMTSNGEGAVVMYKNYDEGKEVFPGEVTEDALHRWIRYRSLPSMGEFDNKLAGVIFSEGNPGLFLMRTNENNEHDETLKQVAPELSKELFVTYTQLTQGLGGKLVKFAGVSADDVPSVWIIHPTAGQKAMKKYKMEKPITAKNIREFVAEFKEGKLVTIMKSEPIPTEPFDGHVRILVGKNFEEVAFDETKDVLVEFYAPWCGHCKKLAPEYEAAAQALSSVKTLVIAKCDATANDMKDIDVGSFPTLKFFPANSGRKIVDYRGPRTSDGIINWLKKNVNQQIKEEL